MKASSHEKHSKQQWKKQKKSSDPWARSGRGLAGDMGLNFLFFWFFHGFLQFGQKPREHKKKSSDPWARSGLSTHKPKKQKNKKPKNQKQPKQPRLHTPRGGGSDAECWVLSFCFFCFFWFFGFLFFCFFVFFVFCFFVFLVFCFLFFWFFVFCFFCFFGLCVDRHCRCAKQRLPGTVSGCTRSKVDTLQYSNVCYDIVHSANEQQRGMEFNFVRLRHMLLDLCTGNAAICALPQWPVLISNHGHLARRNDICETFLGDHLVPGEETGKSYVGYLSHGTPNN